MNFFLSYHWKQFLFLQFYFGPTHLDPCCFSLIATTFSLIGFISLWCTSIVCTLNNIKLRFFSLTWLIMLPLMLWWTCFYNLFSSLYHFTFLRFHLLDSDLLFSYIFFSLFKSSNHCCHNGFCFFFFFWSISWSKSS